MAEKLAGERFATKKSVSQNRDLLEVDHREGRSSVARLLRNRKARLGGALLTLIFFSAIAAPLIAPYPPTEQNLRQKLMPPAWHSGGSWNHPLGTDHLGRDVLSRIVYGARSSLFIGVVATLMATVIGVSLGIAAGYFGGYIDAVTMRIADVQLAFPAILLALAVMVVLGPGIRNLILILGITGWVFFSRIIRGDVLAIKHREFVEAGRAVGATEPYLIRRYVVPNIVSVSIIIATLTLARVIISESSLSFLGLGIEPPTPSWGSMLAEGRDYLATGWWITTFAGFALMATVIGVNMIGDAVRDVLDPRLINTDE